MKKILIINGHPDRHSFNSALARSYEAGARQAGADVELIDIAGLEFNPNLQHGYRKRMDLEPDLQQAAEKIRRADHLVWVHPVWWGGFPAIMKGFIDRLFLPGITYQSDEKSVRWKKLLKGKTARILTTLDQPGWYYRLIYGRPSVNQLRRNILAFCGVSPVQVNYFGIVKTASEAKRNRWLEKAGNLGLGLK